MLNALPITFIIIGLMLLVVMLMIGVSILAAAGGSRNAYGRRPMNRPPTGAEMGAWGGGTPPSDDRGAHQGHHSPPHHHQQHEHHEPVNPGHTIGTHGGDFGSHSSVGHGGFDGGSHGGFDGGGHSGHF